jgi:hypothetical protein
MTMKGIHTRSKSEAGLTQVHQLTGKVGEAEPCRVGSEFELELVEWNVSQKL